MAHATGYDEMISESGADLAGGKGTPALPIGLDDGTMGVVRNRSVCQKKDWAQPASWT